MEQTVKREYASSNYLLPADSAETERLNLQHRILTKAFEDRLVLAPITLRSNDRVLESGAGTGIWAQEFSAFHSQNNVLLDIECIDISDKQFPHEYPSNIHFSIRSVIDLPQEWQNSFSYVHQRLLVAAMNDSRWNTAIDQLYNVLKPGAWIELVEVEANGRGYERLGLYLPKLLAKKGFVDIHCEGREIPIRESVDNDGLNRSKQWHDMFKGMKTPVLTGGGFGIVGSEEEFDQLLEGSLKEWNESDNAHTTYYAIVARKPD
ncbi:hypothetical protein BDP27DRAFT_1424490 [Rhodocollybia butyracea]|uniref:S-adenosyl-L-methionine-dependent methyltransferase n=1 Tax=Rhodocollybia butyracea TaxID=206335 RepID=A0A9P5U5G0_9AGAR|nr:hypothetical protein BDP27DRAFT_1424490 [Rhodocollybia butyracea]